MDVAYLETVVFFYDFHGFGGIRSTWGKHPSKNTYGNSFLKLTPMVFA